MDRQTVKILVDPWARYCVRPTIFFLLPFYTQFRQSSAVYTWQSSTNLKLSLNRASLSLSLYNTTYIAWLYNSRGNYAGIFLFYNWEKTTTSFDITDGGCCCCCAPSSFMENFYREFILLDLQHIILGRRSIERTGERLLQGLCNQQSSCSLIYRVRKRRTQK